MKALIGYTGFVGSNLQRAARFDALFNSRNYRAMADCNFDLVVCRDYPLPSGWRTRTRTRTGRKFLLCTMS